MLKYVKGESNQKLRDVVMSYYLSHPSEAEHFKEQLEGLRQARDLYNFIIPSPIVTSESKQLPSHHEMKFDNNHWAIKYKGVWVYLPFQTQQQCESYWYSLEYEQLPHSPHNYSELLGKVDEDVIVDCGAAEGFFAVDHIDKKRVILIESEPYWIECLKLTFGSFNNVEIRNGFLGAGPEHMNLDKFSFNPEDKVLVKMDIEGFEVPTLKSSRVFMQRYNSRIIACTYHSALDAQQLESIATKYNRLSKFSEGYMLFPYGDVLEPPFFRKGLIIIYNEYQ